MKKILISLGVVVAIALYAVFASRSNNNAAIPPSPITTPTASGTASNTATGGNNNGNGAVATTGGTGTQTGQYKDGSYTGPLTDAIYGKIQVVAVIQNGQLANVQIPVYPNAPGHTTEVSQQALPTLVQEAIQSQSANVNIVSGATQTSGGFQQSLAAALAMAK